MSDKTTCRTPNAGGTTNLPTWKYDAVRRAILAAIPEEGISFSDLRKAAKAHVTEDDLQRLGSWGWHATTVKLEMEVAGDIARVKGRSPQWIVRT